MTATETDQAGIGGPVAIIGAGIGGLVCALDLHAAGIGCQVYEAAAAPQALGVGINLLPHAMRELTRLGLGGELAGKGVITREAVFYTRFGQLVYTEPLGRFAGYEWPQVSIHRGDLHDVLMSAVRARLGPDAVRFGHRCSRVIQDESGVVLEFADGADGAVLQTPAAVAVGYDGVNSAVRRQLYPDEGPPHYTGVTMWRGVTVWRPHLSGASMVRAGWLATGKMVIYPIRDRVDTEGRQLVNWLAEIETPQRHGQDWTRQGRLADFIGAFADWYFDWLDVPAMIESAQQVLEYPMVDAEPLPRWSFGRVTLAGDAAHPMVPRGSNGAGQAILDAAALTRCLTGSHDPVAALSDYDSQRREATARVVRMNRANPPDAILREVYERSGDRPFDRLSDIIDVAELQAISDRYKAVASYAKADLVDP